MTAMKADRSALLRVLHALVRHRGALCGLIVLAVFGMMALLAPWVDRYDPNAQHVANNFASPNAHHWLGTDLYGRDEYSRLVHGARTALAVGILTQVFAVGLGLAVGMAAGLGGRHADTLLMRTTDIAYSFPDLLMLILLVSLFGSSATMLVLAIGLVSWPTIARLVRGQVLSMRNDEFVVAARAIGASDWRIAYRHLLPNLAGPVIVLATFGVPSAIFAQAALSFIGLGPAAPEATWGGLVSDSFDAIHVAPYLAIASCSAIALTMMSFSFIGDGLRDALDPRSASRRPRMLPETLEPRQPAPGPSIERRAA